MWVDQNQSATWIAMKGEKTPRKQQNREMSPGYGNLYNHGFAKAHMVERIKADGIGVAFHFLKGHLWPDGTCRARASQVYGVSTVSHFFLHSNRYSTNFRRGMERRANEV
jgi:hypothetical protein